MNPHNPLLNRLFETKTSKKKRASETKQQHSIRDKVLVPKLASKPPMQIGVSTVSERQKTTLLKPNLAKLPPLSQKQIPGSTSKKTTFRQRKVSFRDTSHDQMLFPTQLNFSTPQLQSRQQQEQIKIEKQPPKKYKTVASQPVLHQTEEQLFEYLKILQKNQELKEQFCYMNRGEFPYSYYIVDYEDVNKKQFLTVSLRGVSIFKQGQNEFTTVDKLSRQIQLYRKVKKIQFFQRYLIFKTLKHWKYRTVRKKFQLQCRTIGKNLLSQNIIIQKYLQFLFNIAEDFVKCKFLDVRFSTTGSLENLHKQLEDKQLAIQKSVQYFQQQIQKNLKETIQKNLSKFRQQERVSLTTDGKEAVQQGFLPYDTKKRSMKYTQMAKLKQFEASMYRLLKMTDCIRFTTKALMVKDGLQNFITELNNLHEKYLKRKEASFVSWVNMKIKIIKPNKNMDAVFECTPTIDEIQSTLQHHLKVILDRFYKKHYLLIERKDDYYCSSFEPNAQQFTTRIDFKCYIEQNNEYIQLKNKCQEKIQLCLSSVRASLQKAELELLSTYNESFMTSDINSYMENQPLKLYLISQAKSRQFLSKWEPIVEFGMVYLDMSDALVMVRDKFEQKFKYISNAIPFEVVKRCEGLAEQIKQIYNMFKENPSTVQQFINFMKRYNEYKIKTQVLQKKIDEILELQDMVYKNGLRIGEASKIHINQCSTYYRQLQKRFEQIQANQQRQRKKFYKMIDDMVQPLDQKSQQMYNRIYEDNLISNSDSNTGKCLEKLEQYQLQFKKLKDKKQELFYYQNQLKLGNKDLPNYFKLESSLQWIIKIWKGRNKYQEFLNHINTKGYAQKSNLNVSDLKQFQRDIQIATTEIQFPELLQNFKQDSTKVLTIIQICRLLSADTLQDQHKNKIKEKLITQNKKIKDYLFLIEGGRTIICNQLIRDTNILQIRQQLEETVHASAQESLIKKNIQQIQQFWKKSRIQIVNADLAKNGSETLHFGRHQNQRLQQKIGSYLMTFKNILGSKHSVGELNKRVMQQILTCEYFKKLIQKWIQVQREWIKLLPLMTNCPSVKHQSNVYFQFTSVDNNIRKHNRNIHDLLNVKKIADDYVEKRYLNLMQNCQRELIEVNKIFTNFLEMKRNTYHRFFFLADQELITILQNTKDGKSMAKYAGYCFNCDRLLLDKQLISGFETPKQVLKLRKGVLKGEPDQMFKNVQQNMKQSLKSSILTLIPKMKIGMNIEQEHQNCLQSILVADKFLWTEMSELYMNPTYYESYQLYLRRSCEQLIKFVKKPDLAPQYRYKISVRLAHAMGLRELGQEMVKLQVTKQDFKWKQQRKYTLQQQQIVVTQFNRKFLYGLQYYPPSKITIPTDNFRMLLSQVNETSLGNKLLLITGVEGDGKRNLMYASAQEYGCFYKELVCNKNISVQYIMRFVQGAILAGAWLSFYEFEHLQNKVLVRLLNQIKKVITKLNENEIINNQSNLASSGTIHYTPIGQTPILRIPQQLSQFPLPRSLTSQRSIICTHNRVMFTFITHGLSAEKVSAYKFDSFVICQPNYKKICEWLLQVNNFVQWENISVRLIVFLETIFPLLQRVMGSFMSILRKVIDSACYKKKTYDYNYKQTQIFAETFKEQILQKSDENIHHILYEALHAYFYFEIPEQLKLLQKKSKGRSPLRRNSLSIDNKLLVLKILIKKKVDHILVIGPRTNKSRLIRQACASLDRQILTIYPQASQYFFHDDAIQKLNKLGQKQIIHYDGQYIVREWNDLVISGYLLMQGKKIHLHNQLIIQLREVTNCSPSFVGSCQIVYVGNSFTKKDRFELLSEAANCQAIMEAMTQIFGEQLQNLPDHLIEIIAHFLKPYAKDPRSKNYHKLISWLGTVLGIEGLWSRFYGGRFNDVTVNKYTQQLVPIDESKYPPVEEESYGIGGHFGTLTIGNLLVHTKTTILFYELYRNLMQISMPVLLYGKYNSGKSTIIKLILSHIRNATHIQNANARKQHPVINQSKSEDSQQIQLNEQQQASDTLSINLPVKVKTSTWTKLLKSSLTNIRREGKNFLVNIGDNDIIIAVDDLDLGFESHREYLRQIIDLKSLRDGRFEENMIEKAKIVVTWHKQKSQENSKGGNSNRSAYKLFDRMAELQIPQFSKQALSSIIRTNIEHFTKKNNMSKEVVNVIDTHLIKCLLIAFDDIANISGQNYAASIVMAVMRNLLSMPKKNVLMNAQNYVNYFKIQLRTRMMEKCFTTKNSWQYKNVYQNLNKVILNSVNQRIQPPPIVSNQNDQQDGNQSVIDQTVLVYQQKQYKSQSLSKLKQKISQSFPHLYIFDQMLKLIIKLNNQLQTIDHNCILIGRSGTGKQTILQIVASLNKTSIYVNKYDLSECILKCLRGESVILLQSYLRRDFRRFVTSATGTLYQKIYDCLSDEELYKLVTDEKLKKQYNQLTNLIPNKQGSDNLSKALNKVKQKLKNIIVFDTVLKYKQATNRFRQLNRYFVCYIDQWPAQALLNISGIHITRTQIQSDTNKKSSDVDLPKLLAEVYATTNRIMQDYDESAISINKFKNYLKIYEYLYQIRNQQLTSKVQFYTKIYSKFRDGCNLIAEWQRRVDILRIELEESAKRLDQQFKQNRLQSFIFAILYSRKAAEQEIVISQNEQMAQIKRKMEKQLQGLKKMMEKIQKLVGSIQRTEMSELKKIYKSSELVSFGLQILCLLLGEQPQQKSINKILADSNLMMKMKSNSLLQNKNVRAIDKFKKQFDDVKAQYESKPKNQVSRILIDWIRSVLDYWNVLTDFQALNAEHKKHKEDYEQSLSRQAEIEESIKGLSQTAIKLNKNCEQLFRKKQQNMKEYGKINVKLKNARILLPALKKSEQQTWEMIKQLRNNLSGLLGNMILATTCLVYLPLKRLRLKKHVLDQIKKLLNAKMVEFSTDFMSLICRTQDAVLEDLNLVAIKQLQDYPVLIIDPQRRAMSFLYEQDPHLAATVISKNLSDLTKSEDVAIEIEKHVKKKQTIQQNERVAEKSQKLAIEIQIPLDQSQSLKPQEMDIGQSLIQSAIVKYDRKNPILHTTDENFKPLLQKLPQNTFVIDWKFTTIDTSQKIFLKIATSKKPQYFQAKKFLNKKIKKDLSKIEEYKSQIYHTICDKQIKILQDTQFIQMGTKLVNLQIQTEQNRVKQKLKIEQIRQYAKQINEQVTKVLCIVNSLKKIKNIALDLVLDIACTEGDTLQNMIKWILCTLPPNKRLGWMLSIALQFSFESNDQLLSILVKDTPLKISQIARHKKPVNLSTKNYENLCKLSGYSTGLKNFCQAALRNSKQFEVWTLDNISDSIPSIFKPETLSTAEQLTVIKIMKPKILLPIIKKHIKSLLKLQSLQGYNNKQLIHKTSKKFPIITYCTMQHIERICSQLNNSKLCIKNLVQITDQLQMKRFLWSQMSEGNWVVFHSVFDINSRQTIEDIIEYVSNYEEQPQFRIFLFADQVELRGYDNYYSEISTKYNNISRQASKNKKSIQTQEAQLLSQSKYIENIGVNIYEEVESFRNIVLQTFDMLGIQMPTVNAQMVQQNPSIASFLIPQTPKLTTSQNNKPSTPLNASLLIGSIINNSLPMGGTQKQKVYLQKLAIFTSICQVAAWNKFPKLKYNKLNQKVFAILRYIKQYSIPLEFNLYAVAAYLGRLYSGPLETPERTDVQELTERIIDETKIFEKVIYGIPIHKHSIALAIAGIGRAGIEINKNWIDQKILNSYHLLGCQESYISHKNADIAQHVFQTLGDIRFHSRSIKQEAVEIRTALARLPANVIVFSREVKNILFLHCYMAQMRVHNKDIVSTRQFLDWVNISSNQDFREDQITTARSSQIQQTNSADLTSLDAFTWPNLLQKIKQLTGINVSPHKIRAVLSAWLQNVKRRHQFLLYWNLDNPVLVLHPVLLTNFSMVVSTYVIHYLSTNYQKFKLQAESTNQNILYTLQIQFSRQTDQKQLYMTQGILLPELIYKQFKYNFEYKMLDGQIEWNGEEEAPLIMLKMKKIPNQLDPVTGKEKEKEDYEPPQIQIATRVINNIEIVYKIKTYIDGNFQEWNLRRPMFISE